ncbi:MAG: MBL fold metallo-hydrolase [Alphaproteobacteria bacterium]|nr:MBL fold metallo-hydrolase [Alphaproteobacteria bacterium]
MNHPAPLPHKDFFVKFWGVRGSIACPGPRPVRYGGNTSCLQVQCGEYGFIFDAGTGLKDLGAELVKSGPKNVDIFLSHTHVDHVNGFPFFKPAYAPGNRIKVHAGHLLPRSTVREELGKLMSQPLFPISIDIMAADMVFDDFHAGETLQISKDITLRTVPIPHPNGATAYRIEYDGKSICYVTDTEHTPGKLDETILGLIKDTDIFIYDSTYTDEEYTRFKGWGHSTWQEGVRLSNAAGVKTFVVFHHDPDHDDDIMDGIARDVEKMRPGSVVAREGLVLRP